jgi:presenilin-like A22 family membrane protease
VWLLCFTGVFVVLGQTVGFLLASTAFLRIEGERSWLVSVVYSVVLTVSVWLFFVEFLGVRHYRGLLDLPL